MQNGNCGRADRYMSVEAVFDAIFERVCDGGLCCVQSCVFHQEWGRAREDATRGRPMGHLEVNPSRTPEPLFGRYVVGLRSECMQESWRRDDASRRRPASFDSVIGSDTLTGRPCA